MNPVVQFVVYVTAVMFGTLLAMATFDKVTIRVNDTRYELRLGNR